MMAALVVQEPLVVVAPVIPGTTFPSSPLLDFSYDNSMTSDALWLQTNNPLIIGISGPCSPLPLVSPKSFSFSMYSV